MCHAIEFTHLRKFQDANQRQTTAIATTAAAEAAQREKHLQ